VREIERFEFPVPGTRTLAWVGDTLYDVAAGWRSFPLDGSPGGPWWEDYDYGEQFDAVTVSPLGDVIALTTSTGTQGVLLEPDGSVIRELDRYDDQADAYRYPLTLFTLPNGRTGLVHCPNHSGRMDIEDAVTGEPLTLSAEESGADLYCSRLAVSPSGRYLLTAGWVWHPVNCLMVFDLRQALDGTDTLHTTGDVVDVNQFGLPEVAGACFLDDDVVVTTMSDSEADLGYNLGPKAVGRWSCANSEWLWRKELDRTAGDVLPMGDDFLALYQSPRLYSGKTGELLAEWPDLSTGEAECSITWEDHFSGPARVAVDHANHRFAVTDGTTVTVIQLGPTAS